MQRALRIDGSDFGSTDDSNDLGSSTGETKNASGDVYDRYKSSSFKSDKSDDSLRGKVDEIIEKVPGGELINKATERFDEIKQDASEKFESMKQGATDKLESMKQDVSERFGSAQQWFKTMSADKPMLVAGVALSAGVCIGLGAGVLMSLVLRRA